MSTALLPSREPEDSSGDATPAALRARLAVVTRARERQASFEALIIKLAHLFQASTLLDLDRELPRGLRWVGDFFAWDRLAIFVHGERDGWRLAHRHAVASAPPWSVLEPPARAVNGYLLRLTRGDIIALSSAAGAISDLTDPEQAYLRAHGMVTHVSVPLARSDRLLGVLTCERGRAEPAGEDPHEETRRLHIVAELFAAVLTRQSLERRHRTQHADLAYSGRVAFMGELTATLLNDFTQPLTGVLSSAEAAQRWLASETPPLADTRLALAEVVANAMRAATLVRSLRALLKKRYPHKVLLHLNAAIGEVEHVIRAIAGEHHVEPVIDLTPGLPEIYGDRVQLQHVILNLVRNGAEAMRETPAEHRSLLLRTELWQHTGVLLSISDHGPPLTEDEAAKLFEPFHSTKPDGLGMGLAISRSIVDSHEGAIWWVRRPERGLCVHVALPGKPEP
jgi:signal transduction histidine kinase